MWVKSSYSGGTNCVEVMWRKASYCQGGECIEVAGQPYGMFVRDSKNPDAGHLDVDRQAWMEFVAGIKAGEFCAQ